MTATPALATIGLREAAAEALANHRARRDPDAATFDPDADLREALAALLGADVPIDGGRFEIDGLVFAHRGHLTLSCRCRGCGQLVGCSRVETLADVGLVYERRERGLCWRCPGQVGGARTTQHGCAVGWAQ